jgi:hypothetical protein
MEVKGVWHREKAFFKPSSLINTSIPVLELDHTVKTEACYAHCWCVHRDNYVAMHTPTVCITRFSFNSATLLFYC